MTLNAPLFFQIDQILQLKEGQASEFNKMNEMYQKVIDVSPPPGEGEVEHLKLLQ